MDRFYNVGRKMRIITIVMSCILGSFIKVNTVCAQEVQKREIACQCIYCNDEKYDAFCDLAIYNGRFYAIFREADVHVPTTAAHQNGIILILSSKDGENWTKVGEIALDGYDLRDPCMVTDKDNHLYIYAGVHSAVRPYPYKNVRFEVNAQNPNQLIATSHAFCNLGDYSKMWIWKSYYHENKFYGIAYGGKKICLVASEDGLNYDIVSFIDAPGNESAIYFKGNNLYVISRNIKDTDMAYMSVADYPYKNWAIKKLNYAVSSPEIVNIKGKMYVAGRSATGMTLFEINKEDCTLKPVYNYFTKGRVSDYAYPGMLVKGKYLYTVYYTCSPNGQKPNIYMNRMKVKSIKKQ